MFWVDEITDEIIKAYPGKDEFIVRDEKTLSGRVHIGSLRGLVIHAIVAQALNEKGKKAKFIFEFNDADPMDGLPVYVNQEKYSQYMGKPLKDVPSPHDELGGKPAKNYADYWGNEFLEVIHRIGFKPEIVYSSDFYKKGHYDKWIEIVLNHKDEIRNIYKEVSGGGKPEDWYPLQIVCENCGKVGTTQVTGWDGKLVKYECKPNLVKWAKGCGHKGETSPFKGRGKLPWKVEWPVKWSSLGVNVEGSGKDHGTVGGSHDIGVEICKKVLKMPVPFNIPYEFFLFGGAKMSSSKGMGASVKEVADTIPPELLRFLMIRKKPNQPIDFNPDGVTIPILFDNHDESANYYFNKKGEFPDLERAFYFSQIDANGLKDRYFPRFSRVSFLEQIPYVNINEEIEKLKGSQLTSEDKKEISERVEYAKIWLENFAPDAMKFEIKTEIPEASRNLSEQQKKFLGNLAKVLSEKAWNGEELHAQLHKMKEESGINPKEIFGSIYAALLGKDSGPQAGWFLESLKKDFLIKRFTDVSKLKKVEEKRKISQAKPERFSNDYFYISKDAHEKYPEAQIAFAIIEGVKVIEKDKNLLSYREEVLPAPALASEKLDGLEILKQYIDIYRRMGVDVTKRKPTAVALFDRIAKGKGLYEINNVVDICNLLTLQDGVSFGAFDMDKIKFPIVFTLTDGGENFWAFGDTKPKKVEKGEFCMKDADGKLLNRDYNYKDSEYTKIVSDTKNIFLAMDSLDPMPLKDAGKKLDETLKIFTKYCGGTVKFKLVA
ncbi:MAG: lysine--tRNA ligase [Candidatus Gracilibacteria bacterium]|jgi:lysyl-tRNA synthetase class 1